MEKETPPTLERTASVIAVSDSIEESVTLDSSLQRFLNIFRRPNAEEPASEEDENRDLSIAEDPSMIEEPATEDGDNSENTADPLTPSREESTLAAVAAPETTEAPGIFSRIFSALLCTSRSSTTGAAIDPNQVTELPPIAPVLADPVEEVLTIPAGDAAVGALPTIPEGNADDATTISSLVHVTFRLPVVSSNQPTAQNASYVDDHGAGPMVEMAGVTLEVDTTGVAAPTSF